MGIINLTSALRSIQATVELQDGCVFSAATDTNQDCRKVLSWVFSAVSAYQGLLRASKFRVGDGSDNDFKKVTKKPAAATEEITQGNVLKVIDEWVHSNNVCLFMKGTPLQPQCGYSKYVVGALTTQGLKNYFSFNILSNPLVREQLKVYSKWPTFPQLYVKGKLVGGCDIVREMQADGSLQKLLKDSGLI